MPQFIFFQPCFRKRSSINPASRPQLSRLMIKVLPLTLEIWGCAPHTNSQIQRSHFSAHSTTCCGGVGPVLLLPPNFALSCKEGCLALLPQGSHTAWQKNKAKISDQGCEEPQLPRWQKGGAGSPSFFAERTLFLRLGDILHSKQFSPWCRKVN